MLPASAERIAFIWDGVRKSTGDAARRVFGDRSPAKRCASTFRANNRTRAARKCSDAFRGTAGSIRAGCSKRRATESSESLAILGVNPVLHCPDRALVDEALAKVEFVVVSELFPTETAELATLVLPACGPFEKTGTTTNSRANA